ncbi:MAG: alpha/beta fold hydrolase [Saprospiraceae bacterium]
MKLNYKILGSGPPLIILHGLFGMLDNWRTIARMLEDKYQCILVDLRNHGRSPHDDEMNYQVMTEDVLELMNDLHIEHTYMMGHSMGGKVAMLFALTYPEKVDKLIVVDIAPKEYPIHHAAEIEAIESVDPAILENRTEAEELLRKKLGDDQATIQFLLKNLSRKSEGGFEWKANMPVLISNYDKLMEGIVKPGTFDKPVLFISGQMSDSIRDEDLPDILTLFPSARLSTVPNAAHWVHADQPELLKNEVLAFIDG